MNAKKYKLVGMIPNFFSHSFKTIDNIDLWITGQGGWVSKVRNTLSEISWLIQPILPCTKFEFLQ